MNQGLINEIKELEELLKDNSTVFSDLDIEQRIREDKELLEIREKTQVASKFHTCSLCRGKGKIEDWGDHWDCWGCLGLGGYYS